MLNKDIVLLEQAYLAIKKPMVTVPSDEREEDRKSEGENFAINNKSAIDDQDDVGVKSDTDSFRVEDSEENSEE